VPRGSATFAISADLGHGGRSGALPDAKACSVFVVDESGSDGTQGRQVLTCKRASVPAVYIAGPHKLSIAAKVFDDQIAMVQDRRPHNLIETVDAVLTRCDDRVNRLSREPGKRKEARISSGLALCGHNAAARHEIDTLCGLIGSQRDKDISVSISNYKVDRNERHQTDNVRKVLITQWASHR
jgi:hypothetical protein